MNQVVDESDDELNVQDAPLFTNSLSTVEVMEKKKKANIPSYGARVSSASPSEQFRNMRRKKGIADDTDCSRVILEDAFRARADEQNKQHKLLRSDTKVTRQKASARRVSSAYAKGWGNGGGSMYDLSELPDLKERRQFSKDSDFFSRKSFKDVGCNEYMIECLKRQHFQRPSHIQAMAFAPVVEGKSSIVADQSGSSKTLAYLAPVDQRLKQEELQGLKKFESQSPQVVILVPTTELASQCCAG